MASIKAPQLSSKAILQIDINEQKWEISLANGKGSQQMCPKVPFFVYYFSTFSSTTFFFFIETTILCNYADDKTVLCILQIKILIL